MNNSIQIWINDLNRYFSKEDICVSNQHMKRYSTSLIIRQIQIKTTMRYHLSLVGMTITNKATNSAGEGVEKRESILLHCGNAECFSHCEEQCIDTSKN